MKESKNFIRVNFQIRSSSVRVTQDGNQLGIIPTDQARRIANEAGLDLIETVAHTNPPVCIIAEYGKYRYEQKLKLKEQRKKTRESMVEIKELRLSPAIQEHDIQVKIAHIKKFLSDGKKVVLNLQYKRREFAHKEQGFKVMNKIIAELKEIANIENLPKLEGKKLICRIEPKI